MKKFSTSDSSHFFCHHFWRQIRFDEQTNKNLCNLQKNAFITRPKTIYTKYLFFHVFISFPYYFVPLSNVSVQKHLIRKVSVGHFCQKRKNPWFDCYLLCAYRKLFRPFFCLQQARALDFFIPPFFTPLCAPFSNHLLPICDLTSLFAPFLFTPTSSSSSLWSLFKRVQRLYKKRKIKQLFLSNFQLTFKLMTN